MTPLTNMPVEEFESRRARFPTDTLFALSIGITQSVVSEYRKKHGIQSYRGVMAGGANLGVHYHPVHLMTEERISALYAGRKYQDQRRRTIACCPCVAFIEPPATKPEQLTMPVAP